MERPRHRRSKSLTCIEGNRDIQKQRIVKKFTSDSGSHNDGAAKHMFELTKSSSKRLTGTPVKKLLAEEMSKEMEAKRRSPSVIAKLMGLDGLPSPQHGHRQQARRSGNHEQNIASLGVQRDDYLLDGRSSRRSSMQHQEFRDVHEDLEASHLASSRYLSKRCSNSKLRGPEMSIVQPKYTDAKRVSAYEKLNASKEFSKRHDVTDSNKELLQKFLQEPDSLFVKHVSDLQLNPSSSQRNRIAILKPSNSVKHESNAKPWKSEGACVCKQDVKSHRKRKDGLLLHTLSHHSVQNTLKSSKVQLEEMDIKQNLPTQIVVLKPGKTSNAMPSLLSPDLHAYLPDCRRGINCSSFETAEAVLWEERDLSNFARCSRPIVREAREVAKKITMQVRENFEAFNSGPIKFSDSGMRGYAGDESSYDVYDSESDSASDVMTVTARKSFGWNSRRRAPSSTSTASSVNSEAKKRLSERWNMTHRYQDEEISVKGSTLGEMLAIPDRDKKLKHLDAVRIRNGASDGFAWSDITTGWNGPSGIRSRDGWKDGCVKRSSRSRSLPPSLGGKSQKTSEQLEAVADGRCLVTRETMNCGSRKAVKRNLSRKEGASPKELRSGGKRPHSFHDKFVVNTDAFPETKIEINTEKLEASEEQPLASPEPRSSVQLLPDLSASTFECSVQLLPDLSASTFENGDSSACDHESSTPQEAAKVKTEEGSAASQCPAPETESSESSKEADHPSPVSVLEVAFTEDTSSGPECFERVSAELQELRMQLNLLKMESEVDADESTFVTYDDDGVPQTEDEHMLRAESWEDFYIVDVLLEFGLEEPDLYMLNPSRKSLDFPLGALVFDNLEKKYSDVTAGMRSERRLLFDRINSALEEIFQPYVDMCPWVKPATGRIGSKWQNYRLTDALMKLLEDQESNASGATPEKMLDEEMEWSGYRDEINVIGKEIEKLLTDELVMEAVTI